MLNKKDRFKKDVSYHWANIARYRFFTGGGSICNIVSVRREVRISAVQSGTWFCWSWEPLRGGQLVFYRIVKKMYTLIFRGESLCKWLHKRALTEETTHFPTTLANFNVKINTGTSRVDPFPDGYLILQWNFIMFGCLHKCCQFG